MGTTFASTDTTGLGTGDTRVGRYPPATPTPKWEIVEALQQVKALETLQPSELEWLAEHGIESMVAGATSIFRAGQPARQMIILLRGEIHVRRANAGPVSLFLGRSGQLTGKLPFSRMKTYGGDGFAVGDVWALEYDESLFPAMLHAAPALAQIAVSGLLDRVREVTRVEQQAEKLNALGKLAANLSHELNNPASAARSAANNLWIELRNYGDQKFRLGGLMLSQDEKQAYGAWMASVSHLLQEDGRIARSDAMEVTRREEVLLRWMEAQGVEAAWRIAPTLAETRVEVENLDALKAILPAGALTITLASFASALKSESMTDAIIDSTRRIFDLISAIKDYSYMDQGQIQEVDLAQALDNTLAMLNSRLGGVEVVRQYGADVGTVSAYGGELNQVWTALVENALDAMALCGAEHKPVLTLRTTLAGSTVLVEVCDNGPGIADDIKSRIFEPFFTTKAVGVALGLGLDTASRLVTKHKGQMSVQSRAGETCVQVRLPIEQTGAY